MYIKFLTKNKIKVLISAFLSAGICILCYLLNNCPYPYFDKLNLLCWLEYNICEYFPEKNKIDDALFINVSYDKQLVSYVYDNGNLNGKIDITDRATLLKFLEIAKRTDTYKYIFLDIRFEKGTSAPEDTVLFNTISTMRDIVYSKHSDIESLELAKTPKAAYNDYYSTIITTNFTRYQFLQNGTETVPLKMYLDIYKSTAQRNTAKINKKGILYFADGKLCQNSPFVRIGKDFNDIQSEDGELPYYDLGPVLLEMYDDSDWFIEMKDKIVVVGDFVNDLHDTYRGPQPGPYLVYLAFKELESGKHYVSWLFIFVTFILYFVISMFILVNINLATLFYTPKSRILNFLANLLGYGTILTVFSIILYIAFKTAFNIFIPSITFSILSLIVSFKRFNYE